MLPRTRARTARLSASKDVLLLAALLPLCVIQVAYAGSAAPLWAVLALHAALLAPLLRLRRAPIAVFAVTAAVSFAQWAAGADLLAANLSVLIAMYRVAAWRPLPWAVAAGAVAELGVLLLVARPGAPLGVLVKEYAAFSVFVVAIWIAGIHAATRRRYVASLMERAEQAERERGQQAVIAAAAERARIARELHDVVAHHVSVIVLHAEGAGYAVAREPDLAQDALATISTTGRRALAEMRRLVSVLRDESGAGEPRAPQPGLSRLGELVERSRASGLPAALTVHGTPPDLPEGQELAVYRIVQEALTNALKHGGPGTRARVELRFGPGEVALDVTDDGRGAATLTTGGGHGLTGMRERAAMYGGTVEAAPLPGGGFRVSARLPVAPDDALDGARLDSDGLGADRFDSDRLGGDRFDSDRLDSDRCESVREESGARGDVCEASS
ncbi:sensor histidine kinase [Nonomuraea montanisoli]|uniref:sensor histidine kinase n=1 Tax=Nonomuraea montanisoli TaxID=2741721 RepID=UPI002E2D56AD|nr:histidine kinase [Nonomuraea montanisoli]